MAKYLIHTCKDREWYVRNFLIPSMVKQGIDINNIYTYIDINSEGNLLACMNAFEFVSNTYKFGDSNDITWHLQDDVAISKEFKQYTECKYESDIICAFCTREQIARPIGQVDSIDMWYSFQCIGIRNEIASACANWFYINGLFDERVIPYFEKGLGDDEVFKYYCSEVCSGLKVLNLMPNLVEHIDFLIGGSTAAKGMPQRRAMYLKDGTEIVQKLMEELKQYEGKRTEIKKLFWETAICEECNVEMIGTGNYLASNPTEYELICPKCWKKEFVKECYPRMNFGLVQEVQE